MIYLMSLQNNIFIILFVVILKVFNILNDNILFNFILRSRILSQISSICIDKN